MRSELSQEEIEQLLDDAEDAWPDSDFVQSVRDQFEDRGFITERQEESLSNIVERGGR